MDKLLELAKRLNEYIIVHNHAIQGTMVGFNLVTDKEVEDGYVLTCQAYPTSDELIVSYDE